MTDTTKLALWLDARAQVKAEQAELADRLAAIEEQIHDLLGEQTEADTDRWRVTWRWVESTRVDTRKVRELLPASLLEAVQTTKATRVLRVSERDA